jgi:hypothetical protein
MFKQSRPTHSRPSANTPTSTQAHPSTLPPTCQHTHFYSGPPVYKLGYGPQATVATAALLHSWRARLQAPNIPIELHEFGTYVNRKWRPSGEPGSFGAAWNVANWIGGISGGVTRFFHWAWYDTTWLGIDVFWISSLGWAMTAAQLATTSITAGTGASSGPGEMSVLAVAQPVAGVHNVTITAAGFHGNAAQPTDALVLLVAALSDANKSVASEVNLTLPINARVWQSRCGGHGGVYGVQMRLDQSSSPFDAMLKELQAAGGYVEVHLIGCGIVYHPLAVC